MPVPEDGPNAAIPEIGVLDHAKVTLPTVLVGV